MTVKSVEFAKKNLKRTNYINHWRKYKGMHTKSDNAETAIPESVIKVIYRIFDEVINSDRRKQDEK